MAASARFYSTNGAGLLLDGESDDDDLASRSGGRNWAKPSEKGSIGRGYWTSPNSPEGQAVEASRRRTESAYTEPWVPLSQRRRNRGDRAVVRVIEDRDLADEQAASQANARRSSEASRMFLRRSTK
jgi:hypothetical protein